MKVLALILLSLSLSGCGTLSLRAEYEHISHPTVSGEMHEDTLNQLNLLLRTERDGWYAEGGAGWNMNRHNGGGFMGPELTGTFRFGREFRLYRFAEWHP